MEFLSWKGCSIEASDSYHCLYNYLSVPEYALKNGLEKSRVLGPALFANNECTAFG